MRRLIREEIDQSPAHRAQAPDYCHRVTLLLRCQAAGAAPAPRHPDQDFVALEWRPVQALDTLPLLPHGLGGCILRALEAGACAFGGTFYSE